MAKNFLQIVLFGDSMTWSPGVPVGARYVDFIEEKLLNFYGNEWIIDVAACGDGGNTAEEGFARIQRDCISYQPHIVVIHFGANDCIRAPDRENFKSYYRKILKEIKNNATKYMILETIPTLDEQWHSQRNNPKALFYGGLENYLEFFSHSFIRETAENENLPLHDRFKIYHKSIQDDPSLREKLIQKDGVHLTEQGNKFFAETLVSIIQDIVPQINQFPGNPEIWLEQAELNPVYIDCLQKIENASLKEYLTETPNLKRLMIQKTRSFSKRAMAFADDEETKNRAIVVESLASGLMAAERIFNNPDNIELKEKSRNWAISHLAKISENPSTIGLMKLLE